MSSNYFYYTLIEPLHCVVIFLFFHPWINNLKQELLFPLFFFLSPFLFLHEHTQILCKCAVSEKDGDFSALHSLYVVLERARVLLSDSGEFEVTIDAGRLGID